ncbi:hypothetical protein GGX14DRAFT_388447 [Mycena pura]|uniref:Uncharacterized protein n=1 Tax=Mycena pura TaxID=153505 RepID=A0AAD6VS45_9AGAR|nr:hypothetical protein GGX14DRAFT_388447 [Mycena pura]
MAKRICRPISESAADIATQKCPNYEPIWDCEFSCPARLGSKQPHGWVISESAADIATQIRWLGGSAADVAAQKCPNYEPIWDGEFSCLSQIARRIRRPISESAADVAAQMNLVVWADLCHSSQIARKIRRPISESAADVAAQIRWLGGSAGPYQNPRLMLLLRNGQITNQFGTVNLVVWPDLCHSSQIARRIRRPISESAADVAAQMNLVVWADLCHSSQIARKIRRPISESAADVAAQIRWLGGSAGPYQNPRLMLLIRNVQITNQFGTNVQITNQFGTVNLVVWPDLCHSSQIARKIRRPISESAADVAAQIVWPDLCQRASQIARKIRRPISESAADVAAQKCPNYEPIWHGEFSCLADLCHSSQIARKIRRPRSESAADVAAQTRSQGRSAGPDQNPRLMLLLRNVQITNQFGTPDRKEIRRPISESAADVAAQTRSQGRSAGPYQNPRLMLLLRNVQITNQFGTVNLVVWPDLCHSSQIARKIRRPISESAADVAAQKCPNYEPIWHVRSQGRSAGPYQNPRLMLLLRLSGLTCAKRAPTSQMARRIRRPISESAADVAAQTRSQGRSAGPDQNPRLMLLLRNVQITNQFGTLNLVVWPDLCHSSQIARKICQPRSESAADVAAQKCPNYEPIWHVRWLGGSAGPDQNPRLMLLLRNVQITNQFGTVNLVVWPDLCHSSQIARKIRRPRSESTADVAAQTRSQGRSAGPDQNPRLMLLLRVNAIDLVTHILEQNVQITNQFGTVNLVVWADLCHSSQIARKIRQPRSESAADVAAQSECNRPGYPYFGTECPNYKPIWHDRKEDPPAQIRICG